MINPKRQKTTLKKEQFYVDPTALKDQIREYYKTEFCTIDLGENINKIANGLSHSPSFHNYTYRDEMVGDAILKMWSALKFKKFNLDSETNPFSYFTTIAFHAFINRIKKEKRQHESVEQFKAEHYERMLTAGEIHDERYNVYSRPCDGDDEMYEIDAES